MSMHDPIADLLTRIRNAAIAGHETVDIPAARLKEEICAVLKREGFIRDCQRVAETKPPVLRVTLRYHSDDQTPVLHGLRRVSKPSLRVYARGAELRLVRSGLGISIVSTSRGLMTGKQARTARLGGEVLCEVW